MLNQIAVVEITKYGTDRAVFLNGEYIISADPGCGDSIEVVEQVAQSLARLNGVQVLRIPYAAHDNWEWGEIQKALHQKGKLVGQLNNYTLDHHVIDKAGNVSKKTLSLQAINYSNAIGLLVDHYNQVNDYYLLWTNTANDDAETLYQSNETDYHLNPELGSICWISVGNASVYIKRESEGVVVDIYDNLTDEPITTASAAYSDCIVETA